MTREELIGQIQKKKSMLCVGLDTDLDKIPPHLHQLDDPVFEFNRAVIEATHEFAVAYKPNIAFYEALGLKGWQSLQKTIKYLNENHPGIFTIADAKRGDIGNTSRKYAGAFFSELNFDSVTVAPYMGRDSVIPFLEFKKKWVILLALTSNAGADDFQTQKLQGEGLMMFEKVLNTSKQWGDENNLMFVVGATRPEYLKAVRKIAPEHFLLVPGVGAQGGSLKEVITHGMGKTPNLLINSSRGIIYPSQGKDFQEAVYARAQALKNQMAKFL